MGEPRCKLGGVVAPQHAVAGVEVIRDKIRVPQVVLRAKGRGWVTDGSRREKPSTRSEKRLEDENDTEGRAEGEG